MTCAPYSTVAMWLLWERSSSSKVTISWLLLFLAHWAYASRLFFSQLSPVVMEQSCMSLHRFGTTYDTFGSELKLLGNWEKVCAVFSGTLLNLNHGLCFRAYLVA